LWGKEHPDARAVRRLAYVPDRTYDTYRAYVEEGSAEVAANTMICVVHQTNYLVDQLLRQIEGRFLAEGGFTERLYHARRRARERPGEWEGEE
jgi:four helix bundle suffix protein